MVVVTATVELNRYSADSTSSVGKRRSVSYQHDIIEYPPTTPVSAERYRQLLSDPLNPSADFALPPPAFENQCHQSVHDDHPRHTPNDFQIYRGGRCNMHRPATQDPPRGLEFGFYQTVVPVFALVDHIHIFSGVIHENEKVVPPKSSICIMASSTDMGFIANLLTLTTLSSEGSDASAAAP